MAKTRLAISVSFDPLREAPPCVPTSECYDREKELQAHILDVIKCVGEAAEELGIFNVTALIEYHAVYPYVLQAKVTVAGFVDKEMQEIPQLQYALGGAVDRILAKHTLPIR